MKGICVKPASDVAAEEEPPPEEAPPPDPEPDVVPLTIEENST